jgi:uncharacterized membrane protein
MIDQWSAVLDGPTRRVERGPRPASDDDSGAPGAHPPKHVKRSPQAVSVSRYDRAFYAVIAIALAITVVVGFGRTYYLRILSPSPMTTLSGGPVTFLVHVHAALFSTWVLLFIAQTTLIAQRKIAVHRRLGIAGGVLAALMVGSGTLTALKMAARGSAPGGADPHQFLMIPLSDMVLFGGFIAAALLRRGDREAHKRLMLLAYVSIVAAAIARLPGVYPLGPPVFFGLAFLFVLAGVIYDIAARGRVHPVYVWGGALLVIAIPVRLVISRTEAWKLFAQWAVALMQI